MRGRAMRLERTPPTEAAITEVCAFNLRFAEEHAYLPVNVEKGVAVTYSTALNDTSFVVRNATHEIVGSLGLFLDTIWYSDSLILYNRWLNVMPGRHEQGALRILLGAAKEEAKAKGAAALIIMRSNHRSELRGPFGRVAEVVGYSPFGHGVRMRF